MNTPNAAVELLTRNLELHPDKTAYFCGEKALSYRDLDLASRRFACLLKREGVAAGDRVVLALPDCFAFPIAFLGCLLTGAVAVTAGSALTEEALAHVITDSGARLLLTHGEHAVPRSASSGARQIVCDDHGPTAGAVSCGTFTDPHQPTPDDFAFMLYSSGSTGRLKGIPHGHASLLLPCRLMGEAVLGIRGDDVIFSTSKLSFGYGLINSLSFPLYFGATAILHPHKPDVSAILDIIARHGPSILFSVPTIYTQIVLSCAEPVLKLPMRLCCSAGEALPALLFNEWQRLTGLKIIDGMGASELSHHFISNVPGREVAGSTGRVVPGYRVRLVDDNGNDVSEGREGHLLVSGGTRALRYWNLPELSRATMLPDGFTRTGDILREREGNYYYRGRSDDMIKVDAQWVSPLVVEDALRSHPAVAECAVAAVTVGPLVRSGAFVVLVAGTQWSPTLARELREQVLSRLPEFMCPARFKILDELPRTQTGKIMRFRLRELT